MDKQIKSFAQIMQRLTKLEKLSLTGVLILILGLFFPWFTIHANDLFATSSPTFLAFEGRTYIIGYLCFLFALLPVNIVSRKIAMLIAGTGCLVLLLVAFFGADWGVSLFAVLVFLVIQILFFVFTKKFVLLKKIPVYAVNMFAGIEVIILVFVAFMILQKEVLEFTSAGISFGLYLTLLGASVLLYTGKKQYEVFCTKRTKDIFDLEIDKKGAKNNNDKEQKKTKQLSFGDYE